MIKSEFLPFRKSVTTTLVPDRAIVQVISTWTCRTQ